jgi:signal transduction histidine kinase
VHDITDDHRIFLSTLPAGRRDRRLAGTVVLVSAVFFLAAAPFAKSPLVQVWAFIPLYESALVVNDLITAVLLFGQFRILQSRALFVLASGYLFTAFIAIPHALTFPGAFTPTGLLGAGHRTTAALYMLWHGIFPLFVIAYALLKNEGGNRLATGGWTRGRPGVVVLAGVLAVLLFVGALALLATAGHDFLPEVIVGNRYTPAMIFVSTSVWASSLFALVVLWRRRPHTVLDLWLMIVMCAWIFDIALSAVLNGGRWDLGFYAGRIYGLLASMFVLLMLLLENTMLYARLVDAHGKHARRLKILHEIDRAMAVREAPDTIAGAVIQPLRELLEVPRAIVNIFDLAAGKVEWLAAAGRQRTHVGPGVRYSIGLMGDVEALKKGVPQTIDTHALPPGPEVDALLASGVHVYMVMPMIAGGELIGAISFGGERGEFFTEQVSIAREVATQLAIAITQARLYERVRRQAEELELRVRERTAELRVANKELESFSYSVSHDLRTPLRAIDGYSQMLEEDYADRLDAEGRRLLGVIRESSRQMASLIDDLLTFSKLGRQAIAATTVDMNALVGEVMREVRAGGVDKSSQIAVAELPAAWGDRALLKQVWINLLSNAIKFTGDRDQPVIEVAGNGHSAEGVYSVKDNGVGFDMQYYNKLFGVFQRLHSNDEFEGTGVGLAIVQRVVTRHGGRVWAEGKINAGATFYFALPRGDAVGRNDAG